MRFHMNLRLCYVANLCSQCNARRIGVFEVLILSADIAGLILQFNITIFLV